jgi:hypothetical protein
MTIVSVDLALTYRDFGIAIVETSSAGAAYELVRLQDRWHGSPTPSDVANRLIQVSNSAKATIILLDGPQGWKDPSNGLEHSRRCERILNTPAKTGLPGNVKPANYFAYVDFSVRVFDTFHTRGWKRFDPSSWKIDQPTVVESFPLAAWRSLDLVPLPAKAKSREGDIRTHLNALRDAGLLANHTSTPTHDELQALVAGLAGVALGSSDDERYVAVGSTPFTLDGIWREGYIVNPRRGKTDTALSD